MIYSITGTIKSKSETYLIIETNGIGYQVFIPETLINSLPSNQSSFTLYTYHHIREDTQLLYGFITEEDRSFFSQLISVSGVGPKVGLKIISLLPPKECIMAILKEDITILTAVSGVGKKMAERLILELKDKLQTIPTNIEFASQNTSESMTTKDSNNDLFDALKGLGYNQDEIKRAYLKSSMQLSESDRLEENIKILLKQL